MQSGDDVVVFGAGGGVGLAAIQLGVQLGASITAVASSDEKFNAAAFYGARHLINYRSGDLRQQLKAALPGGAAAVVNPVGGELSEPAFRSLRRGGRFVTVGYASGVIPRIPLNLVLVNGVHVFGFQFQDVPTDEFARNEIELAELLATRRVLPHIGAVYPPAETAAALRHVADGRAIGKACPVRPSAWTRHVASGRLLPFGIVRHHFLFDEVAASSRNASWSSVNRSRRTRCLLYAISSTNVALAVPPPSHMVCRPKRIPLSRM